MKRDKAELDRALSPWSPQSKREDSVMHAVTQRQAQKGDGCEGGGPTSWSAQDWGLYRKVGLSMPPKSEGDKSWPHQDKLATLERSGLSSLLISHGRFWDNLHCSRVCCIHILTPRFDQKPPEGKSSVWCIIMPFVSPSTAPCSVSVS